MKKLLITIFPICVILFVAILISWGLKGTFMFFGAWLFITVAVILLAKWVEFVDKHIKD